jgi:hypothetical protein
VVCASKRLPEHRLARLLEPFFFPDRAGIRAELCAAASAGRLNEVMRLVEEGGADVSLGDYDRRHVHSVPEQN